MSQHSATQEVVPPLTIAEAAAFLKISRSSLTRMLDDGTIRSVRAGQRRRLVPMDAVADFLGSTQ